jgi:hypothetical protein
MTSPPSIAQIIRELEQHPDAIRIKKLLIYAADNLWENDPQRLAQYQFPQLVQKLQHQYPALEYLRSALKTTVATLSRPEAYSRIAELILEAIAPLYGNEDQEATCVVTSVLPTKAIDKQSLQITERIAAQMQQHREAIRIKKLLFAICHQRWENDFQVLGQVSFVKLIQQIRDLYSAPHTLTAALQDLIASLNRQSFYVSLGNFILESLTPLYQLYEEPKGFAKPTFPPISIASPDVDFASASYQGYMSLGKSSKSAPEASFPDTNANANIDYIATELSDSVTDSDATVPAENADPSDITAAILPAISEKKSNHFADKLSIYQLKLEVMKYANPLRVKILLFSVVHRPFDLSGQDWSTLRTCDFDDLLKDVIYASPTVIALEIRLSAIAQSLFEPEEHLQAASAIIQSIKLLSQK